MGSLVTYKHAPGWTVGQVVDLAGPHGPLEAYGKPAARCRFPVRHGNGPNEAGFDQYLTLWANVPIDELQPAGGPR